VQFDNDGTGECNTSGDFWVTKETTFEQLSKDVARYFLHDLGPSPAIRLCKHDGNEWPRNAQVFGHLQARPNQQLRQVYLKINEFKSWGQKLETIGNVSTVTTKTEFRIRSNKESVEDAIHRRLKGIYLVYCLKGHRIDEGGLTLKEFQYFASDIKLPLSRDQIQLIYSHIKGRGFDSFLNMLAQVSKQLHKGSENQLGDFITEYIGPHSEKWDGIVNQDLFSNLYATPVVKVILQQYAMGMTHLFNTYALYNPTATDSASAKYLALTQFHSLLQDLELFCAGFDARVASKCFLACCSWHGCSFEPRLLFPGFVRVLYFLSLTRCLESNYVNSSQPLDAKNIVVQTIKNYPCLPFKMIVQHIYGQILANEGRVKSIQQRIEKRLCRKEFASPVGTVNDFSRCVSVFRKAFNEMWKQDGKPRDYTVLTHQQHSSIIPVTGSSIQEIGNPISAKQQEWYVDAGCRNADMSFMQLTEDLTKYTQSLVDGSLPNLSAFDTIVNAVQEANLEFCVLKEDSKEVVWRWGVALNSLGSRIIRFCAQKGSKGISCWFFVAPSLETCALGQLLRVFEFIRGCLDQAKSFFAALELDSLSEVSIYKLSIDRASNSRMLGEIRALIVNLKVSMIPDRVQSLKSLVKGGLEVDHCFAESAEWYQKVRFSESFRSSLLNSWSLIHFELALTKSVVAVAIEQLQDPVDKRQTKGKVPLHLGKAREVARLWFELESLQMKNRSEELFAPICFLWVWTNCFSLEKAAREILIGGKMISDCYSCGCVRECLLSYESGHCWSSKMTKLVYSLDGSSIDELLNTCFGWDDTNELRELFWNQVEIHLLRDNENLSSYFVTFLLFIAMNHPMTFIKVLWVNGWLQTFSVETFDSKKLPDDFIIVSLICGTFEKRYRPSNQVRRSSIQNTFSGIANKMRSISSVVFENEISSPRTGSENLTLIETPDVEEKLVDYMLVLDTNTISEISDLTSINSIGQLPLKPRVRSIWPPCVNEILSHPTSYGFSLEEIASIRLLYQRSPPPEDLITFCFTESMYQLQLYSQLNKRYFKINRLVMTDQNGIRKFCVVLMFNDRLSQSQLISSAPNEAVRSKLVEMFHGKTDEFCVPACLCLLSRLPLFDSFESFLFQTLRLSRSPLPMPLERYISTFVVQTPVPSKGKTRLQVLVGDQAVYLKRPPPSQLPFIDISFQPLFVSLSPSTIMYVLSALLQERKVVLCSMELHGIPAISEALRTLLFPFKLQSIYIPVLPVSCLDFLHAPVPIFMGIDLACLVAENESNMDEDSTYTEEKSGYGSSSSLEQFSSPDIKKKSDIGMSSSFEQLSPVVKMKSALTRKPIETGSAKFVKLNLEPTDVVFVDIDNDRILVPIGSQDQSKVVGFPKLLGRKLQTNLEKLHDEAIRLPSRPSLDLSKPIDFFKFESPQSKASQAVKARAKEMTTWTKHVRECCIQALASILRNYKKYIVRSTHDVDWRFDREAFLMDHPSSNTFCRELFSTQLFEEFVQDTIASKNGQIHDATDDLSFFDDCIAELDNRTKSGRFLRQKKYTPLHVVMKENDPVRTITIEPVKPGNQMTFNYPSFPDLDPMLLRGTTTQVDETKKTMVNVKFRLSEIERFAINQPHS